VQVTIPQLAALLTLVSIAGGAVWWTFRRVNDNAETTRVVWLFARAFKLPMKGTDDEIVSHIREKFPDGTGEQTGEHEVIRPGSGRLPTGAPRRPALRQPLRREED
jgi:hypothetical protein